VGPRTVLDVVMKRKIPSPRRESNPRTPIVQPIAAQLPFYVENVLRAMESTGNIIMLCHKLKRTAVKIQVDMLWVVTPCNVVVGYQRLGAPFCVHLHPE
jgi:hypothetical protein